MRGYFNASSRVVCNKKLSNPAGLLAMLISRLQRHIIDMFWKFQLHKCLFDDFIWKAVHAGAILLLTLSYRLSLYLLFTAVYLCICTA